MKKLKVSRIFRKKSHRRKCQGHYKVTLFTRLDKNDEICFFGWIKRYSFVLLNKLIVMQLDAREKRGKETAVRGEGIGR